MEGKVIIVTGGSGLLGKAIVTNLKQTGALVFNGDVGLKTNLSAGEIVCDITNPLAVAEMLKLLLKEYGRIDGLVNCAYPRTKDWGKRFEDITLESWKANVDMQLNSNFFICQQVLEIMKEKKTGSIVNLASIYGVVGNDFSIYDNTDGMTSPAAYSAIKGGIINFTRYLASYYGKYNIRINCVSPGGIFNNQHPAFVENYERKVPLKRLGKPEDIAPTINFLLSDGASYITGQNIIVDGGWTAI